MDSVFPVSVMYIMTRNFTAKVHDGRRPFCSLACCNLIITPAMEYLSSSQVSENRIWNASDL